MSQPQSNRPHRRRERYRGTHPRRFEHRYKELQPEAYPDIQAHVRSRGGTPAGTHVPIMVEEVMALLRPQAGEIVADCTLGYGGHAGELLKRIGPTGLLVGCDVDGEQVTRTEQRLRAEFPEHRFTLHRSNFAGLAKWVPRGAGILPAGADLAADSSPAAGENPQDPGFDIIFADLGVSSMQIDNPARGFTYKWDAPLDMRMDQRLTRTAADLVNNLSEEELSAALRDLADEPDHARIAGFIVEQRRRRPLRRTHDLMAAIMAGKRLIRSKRERRKAHAKEPAAQAREAGGQPSDPSEQLLELQQWADELEAADTPAGPKLHPAARTFQALRIMVNDELGSLAALLRSAPYCLRSGGRIGIITFHSGEDRLVKHAFREGHAAGLYATIAEGVTRPTPHERYENPRSAAAKFRWATRV